MQKPLDQNYITTFLKNEIGLFYTLNADHSFQSNIIENIPREPEEAFNVHCTVKPLPLMEKLITLMVPPSEKHIVLDPFAGSGTTLVAAKKLHRSYIGIEIVPEYIGIIQQRLAQVDSVQHQKPSSNTHPYTLPLFE
ncbi:MAG UNVERIFIED_CONTAM: site-specific DNA-methyltransferase [Anaerolineae bacterium]